MNNDVSRLSVRGKQYIYIYIYVYNHARVCVCMYTWPFEVAVMAVAPKGAKGMSRLTGCMKDFNLARRLCRTSEYGWVLVISFVRMPAECLVDNVCSN